MIHFYLALLRDILIILFNLPANLLVLGDCIGKFVEDIDAVSLLLALLLTFLVGVDVAIFIL